jgi:hypothetical protein
MHSLPIDDLVSASETAMTLLDLLGTLAGAAFLVGSVALAILIDRQEAAGRATLRGAAASPPGSSLASGGGRPQLIPGDDR